MISLIVSTSRLSYWTTTRPGIVARSSGAMSTSGAAVTSMPPEWIDRWRGKPSIRAQSSSQRSQSRQPRSTEPRPAGGRPAVELGTAVAMPHRSIAAVAGAAWSRVRPPSGCARRPGRRRRQLDAAGRSIGPVSALAAVGSVLVGGRPRGAADSACPTRRIHRDAPAEVPGRRLASAPLAARAARRSPEPAPRSPAWSPGPPSSSRGAGRRSAASGASSPRLVPEPAVRPRCAPSSAPLHRVGAAPARSAAVRGGRQRAARAARRERPPRGSRSAGPSRRSRPRSLGRRPRPAPPAGALLPGPGKNSREPALGLEVAPDHDAVVRLERLGHPVDQRPREAQRVAHLAHRRPRPVRDEVADHPRVLGPVALVDVLDDLLPRARARSRCRRPGRPSGPR